jgi:hypothetical protein
MSIRSNAYDTMSTALKNLSLTTKKAENSFLKSQESSGLGIDKLEEFIAADKSSEQLCKLIYNQFTALRNDYLTNTINTARYKATLTPLKEFLDSNPKINNTSLNRAEILAEANTYCDIVL